MTDLELIFRSEKEKHDINKATAEDLNKKYFKERSKLMSDLYFHLSFLSRYEIAVKYQSGYDFVFLSKEGHYTAQITSKTENKRIDGEHFYSLCPCTYVVDWKHDSCHSDKIEYTDIKELVKAIAEKYK